MTSTPKVGLAGEYPDQPSLRFAGRHWYARDSSFRSGGPGLGDNWSRKNVVVNHDGTVDLMVTNPTGHSPISAELVSRESFGYGTYTLTAVGEFARLHPAYVFGIFTFDWSAGGVGPGFNEIDISEISSWGAPTPPTTTHAYHPDTGGTKSVGGAAWPASTTQATFRLEWLPRSLAFTVSDTRTGAVVSARTVNAADVPTPRREAVHLNLWDGSWGGKPADGQHAPATSVRITGFTHQRP